MLELSHQLAELTCKVLRYRRQGLDISQDALAQRTGLARTYISDVERGARHPTLHNLSVMALALEWTTSDLVRYTEIEATKLLDPERLRLFRSNELEPTPLEGQILHYIKNRMSDAVVIAANDGEWVLYNQRVSEITGVEDHGRPLEEWSEYYGCFFPDRVTPMPSQELPLVKAMHGLDSDQVSLFVRNPSLQNGQYIKVSSRQIRDPNTGSVTGAVVVFGNLSS